MVTESPQSPSRTRTPTGAVADAVDQLHEMLTSMELLPGHPVRQEALAARLGVSRAPVREALRILASEGLLEHVRNVGYFVKRLTEAEFEQTYLMRRALETEVLRALPPLSAEQLAELADLNARIADAHARAEVGDVRRLNTDFHFLIFRASGLDLVVDELQRIWTLSDAYRATYIVDPAARERIVREHTGMIDALRAGDNERVIALMDAHRHGTRDQLGTLLAAAPRPARQA